MHRTTILLPHRLREQAEREAHARGITFSEFVRQCLAEATGSASGGSETRRRFLERKPWTGPVPEDLAAEHDRYLYGP